MRAGARAVRTTIVLAGLLFGAIACGPEPTRLPPETSLARVEPPLPPPSVDALGHPYRWLEAGKHKYLEIVLGGGDPDAALPVAVFLHGLGDRPRIPDVPEPEPVPLRAILPEAPDRFDRGLAWYPIRVREGRNAEMAAALRRTSDELEDFLATIEARYEPPCRPFVAGFSQGGIVAWALATRHPDAIEAAFPMAAFLPPELAAEAEERAARLPPLRFLHGDADPVVPFDATRAIVDALARRGADVAFERFEGVEHRFTDAMKLRLGRLLGEEVARCLARGRGLVRE